MKKGKTSPAKGQADVIHGKLSKRVVHQQSAENPEHRWSGEAWALPEPIPAPRLPFPVFEREVLAAVQFCRRYAKPQRDGAGELLPGLSEVLGTGTLGAGMDEELLDLLAAFRSAEARGRLLDHRVSQDVVVRSRKVLRELKAVLQFCLQHDREGQAQLAGFAKEHRRARSHDAMAAALYAYAALAQLHVERIAGVGGFDPKWIDEAASLALSLRERSAGPGHIAPENDRELAMKLRNRFARLIQDRLRAIRAAARFVFRNHPAIAREVTSRYGRQRQADWRKRKSAKAKPADASTDMVQPLPFSSSNVPLP